MEPLFDLSFWLGSSRAVYHANRAGVKNLVPMSELKGALDRLVSRGVVREDEANDLINDLKKENLL